MYWWFSNYWSEFRFQFLKHSCFFLLSKSFDVFQKVVSLKLPFHFVFFFIMFSGLGKRSNICLFSIPNHPLERKIIASTQQQAIHFVYTKEEPPRSWRWVAGTKLTNRDKSSKKNVYNFLTNTKCNNQSSVQGCNITKWAVKFSPVTKCAPTPE